MKGAIKNFADTAEFISDQFYFKGKKDSLAAILGQVRGEMTTLSKTFNTWQTSYDPGKKES